MGTLYLHLLPRKVQLAQQRTAEAKRGPRRSDLLGSADSIIGDASSTPRKYDTHEHLKCRLRSIASAAEIYSDFAFAHRLLRQTAGSPCSHLTTTYSRRLHPQTTPRTGLISTNELPGASDTVVDTGGPSSGARAFVERVSFSRYLAPLRFHAFVKAKKKEAFLQAGRTRQRRKTKLISHEDQNAPSARPRVCGT